MRSDILVAALIIGLCAFAVIKQLDADDAVAPVEPLALGEALDPDLKVTLIGEPPFTDTLAGYLGEKATVLMSWSVPCPCVDKTEPRLRHLYAMFPAKDGVAWIAVNGEPKDVIRSPRDEAGNPLRDEYGSLVQEGVIDKMFRLRSFYKLILDPQQQLTGRLGHYQASQIAILDAKHRLVYRGPMDDDYEEGKAEFIRDVLRRLLAGETVEPSERPATYGCMFNDPASCFEYEEREKATAASDDP